MVVSLCLCFLGKDKQKSTPGSNYFSYHLFWFHSRNVKERMPIKKRMRKRKERPPYSLLRSLDFDLSTRSWDLDRHPVVINQYAPDHLMAQDTSEWKKKRALFQDASSPGEWGRHNMSRVSYQMKWSTESIVDPSWNLKGYMEMTILEEGKHVRKQFIKNSTWTLQYTQMQL